MGDSGRVVERDGRVVVITPCDCRCEVALDPAQAQARRWQACPKCGRLWLLYVLGSGRVAVVRDPRRTVPGPARDTRDPEVAAVSMTDSGWWDWAGCLGVDTELFSCRCHRPGRRAGRPGEDQTFSRKVDAERFLVSVEHDKQRGTWVDPELGKTTFGEYVGERLPSTAHLAAGTCANIDGRLRNHLLPYFGELPLGAIRPAHVRGWWPR